MTESIAELLKETDRAWLRDNLSAAIVRVRKKEYALTDADADAIFWAQAAESRRPDFDVAMYDRLWALIPYCPPHPKLEELALIMLGNPSMGYRGEALTYLVEAYPEKHGGLLQKYDQDPSPRVPDAIARQEVLTNPAAAVRRWERIMNRSDLPHDLAETVPASIAYAVDVSELPRFEALAAARGASPLYGTVVAHLRSRAGAPPPRRG